MGLAVIFFGLSMFAPGQQPKERESKPQLRLICINSLEDEQEVVLASKDDKGKWRELGTTKLRSSFTTEWLPAAPGQLHLALRTGEEGLRSICEFTYPATARRVFVLLIADQQRKIYKANVIDPDKIKFGKGDVLITNFSRQTAMVALGTKKISVKGGLQVVARPALNDKGMYPLLVAYKNEKNETVMCFDRLFSGSTDLRKMIFLLPDQNQGFKVLSLPVFGE